MSNQVPRVRRSEIKRRHREISRLYPYESQEIPDRVDADRYFITDTRIVRLAEDHLMARMPAALFFSGTYRKAPKGKAAADVVLDDFEKCIRDAGYTGNFFATAHQNHDDGGIHVHAICDWDENIGAIGKAWGSAHGIWKGGPADPGAYFYVATRASDPSVRTSVLDRTLSVAQVGAR
ncbi:MAG: hypothetical protein HGB10_01385 [Coriobacteriia bacterium]|nr:hypothetical protein [Coriobacteriia bacterium]